MSPDRRASSFPFSFQRTPENVTPFTGAPVAGRVLPDDESEKSPHEPEEFDPNSLGPDAPSVPDPDHPGEDLAPDVPTASDLDPSAVDPATARMFWWLVVVFNVALFGLSVGPMIGFFRGNWDLALQVFLVGVLAFGYGVIKYYRFRRDDDSG